MVNRTRLLLGSKPVIDKKDISGLCDECGLKTEVQDECQECEQIVRTFLRSYGLFKEEYRMPKEHAIEAIDITSNVMPYQDFQLQETERNASIVSNIDDSFLYSESDDNYDDNDENNTFHARDKKVKAYARDKEVKDLISKLMQNYDKTLDAGESELELQKELNKYFPVASDVATDKLKQIDDMTSRIGQSGERNFKHTQIQRPDKTASIVKIQTGQNQPKIEAKAQNKNVDDYREWSKQSKEKNVLKNESSKYNKVPPNHTKTRIPARYKDKSSQENPVIGETILTKNIVPRMQLEDLMDNAHIAKNNEIGFDIRRIDVVNKMKMDHCPENNKDTDVKPEENAIKEVRKSDSFFKKTFRYSVHKMEDVIIGDLISKYHPPHLPTHEDQCTRIAREKAEKKTTVFNLDTIPVDTKLKNVSKSIGTEHRHSQRGVFSYALSDRSYIENGWTILPTEKVVRKMNIYRMYPAHPEFDWFDHNKNKKFMEYDTGEKLAEFDDNGRGRWFYRNGRIALDYYDAEETNAQQRYVVYSSGEPDERGRSHPITVLATFDYAGNGVVFDHAGKIRLKYNQTEGVVLDRSIGPVSHWKWHSLNDPPVLQQVMIDTQLSHKDPTILNLGEQKESKKRKNHKEVLEIEFENFIKDKKKKLTQSFKPYQIKMKALKINECFSLKVLDQATVYLIYIDGSTHLRINIGMVLDSKEIIDTDTTELGEVINSMERLPAPNNSILELQTLVENAQRIAKVRLTHELRVKPPIPTLSTDQLLLPTSRPLYTHLQTVSSIEEPDTNRPCPCKRKPSNNVYYSTSLI